MTEPGPTEKEERELWEDVLTTEAEENFREFVFEQLDVRSDESVLSVGCGPGFETAALAERIGEDGRITGIDVNEEILAAARERCADSPQVSFDYGDITDLPVEDGSYDLVVAKQVLSEVSDIGAALRELHRVTAPGGRVAVTAGDERSHVKNTPTERMERADEVFRAEMADAQRGNRQLGTRLASLLPDAGLGAERVVPRAKIQTTINDQVEQGIKAQRAVLESSDAFDESEAEAWERDIRQLDDDGRFVSCGTAFLYIARKPA